MFGEKAYLLIKDLDRNRDSVSAYNNDLINEVNIEIKKLVADNQKDVSNINLTEDSRILEDVSLAPTMRIRHSAVKRNLRCLLSYHYNRIMCLKKMRWQFGSILPPEIKTNLNPSEIEWFSKYSTMLMHYMRSLGGGDNGDGINLAVDLKPPKSIFIEVRCLVDYGQIELNNGSVLLLKKNGRHWLPRIECEELIRQGVLEHVV